MMNFVIICCNFSDLYFKSEKNGIYNVYTSGKNAIFVYMKRIFTLIIVILLVGIDSSASISLWKPIEPDFDRFTEEIETFRNENNADTAKLRKLVSKMYVYADSVGKREMKVRAIYWDADIYGKQDIKHSLVLVDKAIGMVDTVSFVYDYHRLLALKSNLLLNKGRYFEAYTLCCRLSEYFASVGDWDMKALCDGNTGLIYLFIDDYQEALKYIEKAQSWFAESGQTDMLLLTQQQVAYIYEQTGKKDKATELLKNVIDNFPADGRLDIKSYCMLSYSRLLENANDKKKWIDNAIEAATKSNDWQCRMSAVKNKAFWFFENGMIDSARILAEKLYVQSNTNLLKFGQKGDVCDLLSQIYGKEKRWKEAYEMKMRASEYRDSIHGSQVSSSILKGKVKLAIVSQEYQLRELEMEKSQLKIILWIGSVSLILLLIVSMIAINLLRKKVRSEKKLRELEKKELEMKIFDEITKVDTKNRELSSSQLLSMAKNEKISDIITYLETEQDEGNIDVRTVSHIKNMMNDILSEENNWDKFKMHFEEVHPSFFTKLKEKHPNLTENELRLCAYCKMNISNKHIAQMLSVQPQTIIIARYRLRKKMGLSKEIILDDYIRQF